jgi:hypothetical protein
MRDRIHALILAVCACAVCAAAPARVVVTGATSDCLAGRVYRTAGVEVVILPKSSKLTTLIEDVLKSTDETALDCFNKLMKFVKGTKALARTKSDRSGSFTAEVSPVDRLVVFGYMETEDNPMYWMHADVDISHRSQVSVLLDYCKQP